jgi:hypothetical protein
MKTHPQVVPIGTLSEQLRMPRAFLEREAKAGHIPYLQAGNKRFFNPEAVRAALAKRASTQQNGMKP